MGTGASVQSVSKDQPALTEQQKEFVTQNIKEEFHKLKSEKKDREHIKAVLSQKYDELVTCSSPEKGGEKGSPRHNYYTVADEIHSHLQSILESDVEETSERKVTIEEKVDTVLVSAPTSAPAPAPAPSPAPAPAQAQAPAVKISPRTQTDKKPAPAGKSKAKAVRRRSFEGNTKPTSAVRVAKPVAAASAAPATTAALDSTPQSAPTLLSSASDILPIASAEDQQAALQQVSAEPSLTVDTWDSVTEQPFCAICGMAFKSVSFLDRHVKYSDIHIKNLKQKELDAEAAAATAAAIASGVDPTAASQPVQKEGVHYKALYTGSKFFWRSNETIDLNIYHHILPHCVEVIGFHVENHKEFSRLYFDYTKSLACFEAEVRAKLADEKKTMSKDRFKTVPTEEILLADIQRRVMTSYFLARLQLGGDKLNFVMNSDEDPAMSPLLPAPPVVLAPLSVARRRKSNSEEIETTIKDLAEDRAALSAATIKAERIAEMMFKGVAMLSSAKGKYDKMSLARRRWKLAILRVLNGVCKKKTLHYLDSMKMKKA